MATQDKLLYRQSLLPSELVYGAATGDTPIEKRKYLTNLLVAKRFCICPDYVDTNHSAVSMMGSSNVATQSKAVASGIVLLNATQTSSGDYQTGTVSPGKIACLDYNTGKTVTAVHEDWRPDEFFPIGIFESGINSGRAAVRLASVSNPGNSGSKIFVGRTQGSIAVGATGTVRRVVSNSTSGATYTTPTEDYTCLNLLRYLEDDTLVYFGEVEGLPKTYHILNSECI